MSIAVKLCRFTEWIEKAGLSKKDHQFSGMKFCLIREAGGEGSGGGIIADEMGLGKTILMLGCIISNFVGQGGRFNTLIVLPPALLVQWCEIIERFMGHAPLVYHGAHVKSVTMEQLSAAPIVVTTYGMIATHRKTKPSLLWAVKWNRFIADEAHHLRNMKTAGFCGAMKIDANIKWLVTGTPIHNSKTDLFALCAILGIDKTLYLDPVAIHDIITRYVLRRTKKNVGILLPPLNTTEIRVSWASESERLLAAQLHSQVSFSKITFENVDDIISTLTQNQLPTLVRARQSCVFPHLLHDVVDEMQKTGILGPDQKLKHIDTCSKMTAVANHIISRRLNGRRKIIFCYYRGEIDYLSTLLKGGGIASLSVDGRTTTNVRQSSLEYAVTQQDFSIVCRKWNKCRDQIFPLLDQFLAPQVLIVQIQTACEGLNLQHFQEVYFTSPHWNPAVESQAIARCHRIGQHQRVDVFRFIMKNFNEDVVPVGDGSAHITIDTYCQMVQERKKKLLAMFDV